MADRFEVRFWGVRGSIPTPGPTTRLVGGNTSCLEVRAGNELLILDAGTGVRELGERMISEGIEKATFLFSHVHWDHIMGFPFFRPAARDGKEFVIFGERKGGAGIDEVLAYQAGQAHAPVVVPGKGAWLRFEEVKHADVLKIGPATITCAQMNHPDGCIAYRIEVGGRSVVYATDTEHYADRLDDRLLHVCQDADFLVYDAMFTTDEYVGRVGGSKKGWGHSTWNEGARVSREAGVKSLVLFHHDPSHDDAFIAQLEKDARAEHPGTVAAREGMVLDVARGEVRAPRTAPKKVAAKKVKPRSVKRTVRPPRTARRARARLR